MKILNLTKLKLLYVNLVAIAFFLPSLGGVGGGLYAQDPELFNHTWYFEHGEIDGDDFLLPNPGFEAKLNFEIDDNGFLISHPYCEEQLIGDIEYHNSQNIFNLIEGNFILVGVCGPPFSDFIEMHYSIFYLNEDIPKNPFNYAITTVNNYYQLTIENGEGDWAVYNSMLLSTPSFSQNSFALYPNPVKEILQINNNSTQKVSASVYDINGKKLQSHSLETSASTIDVKALNPGLYFVVFKSEAGERVSKKFIKK